MIKVAITGNIASGKSELEKLIVKRGFMVVDTDKISHDILKHDKTAIREILDYFEGTDIVDEHGDICRQKLGALVFANKGMMYKLETIMHPRINEKVRAVFERFRTLDVIFVSVPLLFEAKMEGIYDKVIFVAADEDLRLKRLIGRTKCNFTEAKMRIKAQMPQEEKVDRADYVIYNNTSIANLEFQLNLVLNKIVKQ